MIYYSYSNNFQQNGEVCNNKHCVLLFFLNFHTRRLFSGRTFRRSIKCTENLKMHSIMIWIVLTFNFLQLIPTITFCRAISDSGKLDTRISKANYLYPITRRVFIKTPISLSARKHRRVSCLLVQFIFTEGTVYNTTNFWTSRWCYVMHLLLLRTYLNQILIWQYLQRLLLYS